MVNIISSTQLIKELEQRQSCHELHVAISHRSYLWNDGGIEHCLRRESEFAKLAKIDFLHLCPVEAIDHGGRAYSLIEVCLNNVFIGVTGLDGFSAKLFVLNPNISFLHSSLGFESGSLIRLLLCLRQCGPILQWVHDLAFACESVTLVRNGLACGVPLLGAPSCYQCRFENSRVSVMHYYDIIERLCNIQLFPSSSAKLRYNLSIGARGRKCLLSQFVVPHYIVNCLPSVTVRPCLIPEDEPVGVAFFGHSVSHKGWMEYIKLVDALYGSSTYRFYHVGSAGQADSRVEYLKFSEAFGGVNGDTLREVCARNNIKLAFFWPVALESFGLMFRQVIGAGLAILSSDNNIALKEFINDCLCIRYFCQLDKLIAWFGDHEDLERMLRSAAQSTCVLEPSNCSYEMLSKKSGLWQLSGTVNPSQFIHS
jgi:hypothetical protein